MAYPNEIYCIKYILLTLAAQGLAILDHCDSQAHKTKKASRRIPPAGSHSHQSTTTKLPRILPRHQIPPLVLGHIKCPQQGVTAGLQFTADLTDR